MSVARFVIKQSEVLAQPHSAIVEDYLRVMSVENIYLYHVQYTHLTLRSYYHIVDTLHIHTQYRGMHISIQFFALHVWACDCVTDEHVECWRSLAGMCMWYIFIQ